MVFINFYAIFVCSTPLEAIRDDESALVPDTLLHLVGGD